MDVGVQDMLGFLGAGWHSLRTTQTQSEQQKANDECKEAGQDQPRSNLGCCARNLIVYYKALYYIKFKNMFVKYFVA